MQEIEELDARVGLGLKFDVGFVHFDEIVAADDRDDIGSLRRCDGFTFSLLHCVNNFLGHNPRDLAANNLILRAIYNLQEWRRHLHNASVSYYEVVESVLLGLTRWRLRLSC